MADKKKHPYADEHDEDEVKQKPLDMSDEEIDPVELASMDDEDEEEDSLLMGEDFD